MSWPALIRATHSLKVGRVEEPSTKPGSPATALWHGRREACGISHREVLWVTRRGTAPVRCPEQTYSYNSQSEGTQPLTPTTNLGCMSQGSLRAKSQWKLVLSHRLYGFRKGIHKESICHCSWLVFVPSPSWLPCCRPEPWCYLWASLVLALEPGVHVTTSGSLGVKLLPGAPAQRLAKGVW